MIGIMVRLFFSGPSFFFTAAIYLRMKNFVISLKKNTVQSYESPELGLSLIL